MRFKPSAIIGIVKPGQRYYVCAFKMDPVAYTTALNIAPQLYEICCGTDPDDEEFLRNFNVDPKYAVPVKSQSQSELDWEHAVQIDENIDLADNIEQSCRNYVRLIDEQWHILDKTIQKLEQLRGQYRSRMTALKRKYNIE